MGTSNFPVANVKQKYFNVMELAVINAFEKGFALV